MAFGNANDSIRAKLSSSIGVALSPEWLQACNLHLQQKHNQVSPEMVLWQVFYSDLRDVVPDGESHEKGESVRQLHDSLMKSRQQPYNQTLPESFQLLCQLEEAVDVAKSTEQRVGNNNSACCKVCLSDGHEQIEGIETASIPNLSPGTLAGSKILLKGPISARHGILLFTPANFIVLGGCCETLVQYQTKALAQKRQGVGVDPTIRALVRNGMGEVEDNDNDDEAFQESGDVNAQPRSPLVGRKRNVSQISNIITSDSQQRNRQQPQPQPQNYQPQNRQQQQQQSQLPRQEQHPRPSMPPPAPLPRKSANPYQRTSTAQEPAKRQRPPNPGTRQESSRITPTPNPTIRNNSSHMQQPQQQQEKTRENPIQNSNTTSLQQSPQSSTTGLTKPPSSPHILYSDPKTVVENVSKQNIQKMTFDNLRRLLLQLVNNRDMYESYYQQKITFQVALSVPDQTRYDFNVTKIPKSKQQKKSKKKYEYFTSALFGSSTTDLSMSCRIHPDLLESCFEVSANDLRALSRTDRPRCTAITNSGGEAVRSTYFGKREWQARLHRGTHEVFERQSDSAEAFLQDLKNPILMLQTI